MPVVKPGGRKAQQRWEEWEDFAWPAFVVGPALSICKCASEPLIRQGGKESIANRPVLYVDQSRNKK